MTCTCHLLASDSQRLLVAARTSTAVLDRTLKAVADTVGGAAPGLVARFKNSLNRTFQRRHKEIWNMHLLSKSGCLYVSKR